MSSTPVQSDLALWASLRMRRRQNKALRGMDAVANRWYTRAKHAKLGMGFLENESQAILDLAPQYQDLTDLQLDARVHEIRSIFARRRYENEDVREGLAAIREIAKRETGEFPYKVQLMGALGLFHGQIVEMVTGEGKTLTAAVATSLLGWLRRPVHVITVNDYLAERDVDSRSPIYRRCGLQAHAIIGETEDAQRAEYYRQPIIYLTQKELVADWLRDQLRLGRISDPVSTRWLNYRVGQPAAAKVLIPGLYTAVVDELDAVLIDEAVTPLIIAQPRGEDSQAAMYLQARDLARKLEPGTHFEVELRKRNVKLTDDGVDFLDSLLGETPQGVWRLYRRREELVAQALTAEHCYHLGQHYQIIEDKVMIVDEYTGRLMEDRQWQHGLHQAAEAKHDLEVTEDRDTLASLSFQRFFKQYPILSGMTGTAAEAIPELEATYGLPVRIIPTNRPILRKKLPSQIFVSEALKWIAVIKEIQTMHVLGRPTLVGTRSVEASELLGAMLSERKLPYQILNAVHHKAEAEIISLAGKRGVITVATNMAGRGTDIKLDDEVKTVGGLHVILTERHTAKRVDRQLYGRSGRQGDAGSARNIICLEDDLVVKFTPRWASLLRKRFRGQDEALPKWVERLFDHAQHLAQNQAFKSRSDVLRHDEELDESLPR